MNSEYATEATLLLRQGNNQTSSDTVKRFPLVVWSFRLIIPTLLLIIGITRLSTLDQTSYLLRSSEVISIPRLGASHRTITLPETCVPNRESVVLIVRHCEDGSTRRHPDSSRHCNALGFQRANYFATLFGSRWPMPSHLYGLIKGTNMRQYETLAPLSNKMGLTIKMIDYPGIDAVALAHREHLRNLCHGGNVTDDNHHLLPVVTVVAWKHAFIPILARKLGCDHCPNEWSDDDFDSVWELHYHWNGEKEPAVGSQSWQVYFPVVYQDFDALAYEYQFHEDDESYIEVKRRFEESNSNISS